MSIVQTNIPYSSGILIKDLSRLINTYSFLSVQIVGTSVLGKPLYVLKLGNGNNKVFYSASIHANEWITTTVLMKFVEDYCISYTNNTNLYNHSIRDLFQHSSIYIMPMVNPDGVDLVTDNLSVTSPAYLQAQNIANNFPSISFPDGWKANINGVNFCNYQPHFLIKCPI